MIGQEFGRACGRQHKSPDPSVAVVKTSTVKLGPLGQQSGHEYE